MSAAVWCVLMGVLVVGLLACERYWHKGIWLVKPMASTVFVVLGASTWDGSTIKSMLVAAFVLCWLGDVLLIPRGNKPVFLAGVLAFLLGHVAFGVGFLLRGVEAVPAVIGGGAFLAVGALVHRKIKAGIPEMLQKAVLAYILVISAMVGLACGSVGAGTVPLMAGVAAFAFAISDISVAMDRFVKPDFFWRLWGLPLYYGAQVLFGLSLQ
jgi:uncharacterized membrane protein YhhN